MHKNKTPSNFGFKIPLIRIQSIQNLNPCHSLLKSFPSSIPRWLLKSGVSLCKLCQMGLSLGDKEATQLHALVFVHEVVFAW